MKCIFVSPRQIQWVAILASWALFGQWAASTNAAIINESIDATKLGVQNNFSCGTKGACGAVSTINSFIYLEKQFPTIYGNKLTPNYNAAANTDFTDANNFGFAGWQVPPNPARQGYYPRPGGAESDFIATKKDWINDYAPGTTVFDTWWSGSPDHNRAPTINDLAGEMHDKEDVEFFVQGTNFFHVLLLTGVMCDAQMNCSITYQDPNDPAQANPNQTMAKTYTTNVTLGANNISFTGVPGSGFAGAVNVTAAFAESPVPEPGTCLLLIASVLGVVGCFRQQTR
jgi:hypothetical protein